MNHGLKRQKSTSSHAASISAWWAVFDWPSMVAALRVSRQGPASSSAARRKTAARSSQGRRLHSGQASAEALIARSTSSAPPWCTSARTWSWSCGMTASRRLPVLTSLPPITHGISIRSLRICSRRFCRLARSGVPGAYDRTGSLYGSGMRKIPGADIKRHSISVQVVPYEVEGWGVGELYFVEDRLVYHEL